MAHAGEFRIFTDTQGRGVEAKVIAYNPVRGTVQVERKDGTRVWVQPNLFSASDRAYLKDWIAANRVLSDENLTVSFDKDRVDHVKKGMKDNERVSEAIESEIICYKITLRNRSKKPIENVTIKYRYFVETVGDQFPNSKIEGTEPGTLTVSRIEPGERVTVKTSNISIDETYKKTAVYSYGRYNTTRTFAGYEIDKVSEEDLLGIWLKIYGPEVEGEPSVRDVCEPDDLPDDVNWD
jgi:hypothetical protein